MKIYVLETNKNTEHVVSSKYLVHSLLLQFTLMHCVPNINSADFWHCSNSGHGGFWLGPHHAGWDKWGIKPANNSPPAVGGLCEKCGLTGTEQFPNQVQKHHILFSPQHFLSTPQSL